MKGSLFALGGALFTLVLFLFSCGGSQEELTPDQIAFQKRQKDNALLAKTVRHPRTGDYGKGKAGGTWNDAITQDPKTFNPVLVKDAETASIVDPLGESLVYFDYLKKEWSPQAASYEIKTDTAKGTLDVVFTLRDDLYWTTLATPEKKVKVTSDDVVYWYNQIDGDPAMQSSAYAQHFMEMPDHSEKPITVEKIDDRKFVFHFPKIIADPELACNMSFGPKAIFEPAKKAKGADGVLSLWAVDTDPKTIPSCGEYCIESYRPGIEVVLKKNPGYWRKDAWGQPLPYIDKIVYKIIPNSETEKLKFLAGELDSYNLKPEDLDQFLKDGTKDYTVYYAGASLSSGFIGWNQNPKNLDKKYLSWFTNQKFRQAMSCFFHRERVVSQVFRGLGTANLGFFPVVNPYYNPDISQKFTYDPEKGKALLAEVGIKPDSHGTMRDQGGNAIEFSLMLGNASTTGSDIASIYADELKKVGITLTVKPVDAQKMWESVDTTYDWQAVMFAFGPARFPSQGSNVWQSSGNLHFWNPLQKKAATDWEARIDTLYSQGNSTLDKQAAKKIWDEYQQLILDQMPLMYMVKADSFVAYRNKWGNVFPDTAVPTESTFLYLKD